MLINTEYVQHYVYEYGTINQNRVLRNIYCGMWQDELIVHRINCNTTLTMTHITMYYVIIITVYYNVVS